MDRILAYPLVETLTNTFNHWMASMHLEAVDLALVAGLAVSWTALVFSLLAMRRIKSQASTTYRLYEKIVHDLHIASNGAIGMGQRIIAVERKIAGQATSPNPIAAVTKPHLQAVPKTEQKPLAETKTKSSPQPEPAPVELDNPFDVAKELLRKGIDQAEVSRRCGLSASETALMAMVLNNRRDHAARLAS